MDADVIKQFVKIIRYADKDTLNAILQLIDISKPLSLLECEDASLKLLNLLLTKKDNKNKALHIEEVEEVKKVKKVEKFEKLLSYVTKIQKNLNQTEIKTQEALRLIIKLILETKTIIYWESTHNAVKIYYGKLNDVLKEGVTEKQFQSSKKTFQFLINHNKFTLPPHLKVTKFKSTYISLAKELSKSKNYCRWCNPNENLPKPRSKRKCDSCIRIEEFIINLQGNERTKLKNRLNTKIMRINDQNLKDRITRRGNRLKQIINDLRDNKTQDNKTLRNVNLPTQDFTQIIDLVNSQYLSN